MIFPVNRNPNYGVEAYRQTQAASNQEQTTKAAASSASQARNTKDTVEISEEGRAYMAQPAEESTSVYEVEKVAEPPEERSEATSFTTFSEEFARASQGYMEKTRDYYSAAHQENLTFENPAAHIWDKYKNRESEYFRCDLSEQERAWAYDQELDLLSGGKHLQMNDPYVFADGIPQLSQVAIQANRACRSQIETAIQELLSESEITLPADTSMRFTVRAGDYKISVSGIEDEELAESVERLLNSGDNGKNLYEHIRLCNPAQFGFEEPAQYSGFDLSIDYSEGRLTDIGTEYGYGVGQVEWAASVQDEQCDLSNVRDAADLSWTHFSGDYDPQREAMNKEVFALDPDADKSRERFDRINSRIRMGMQELAEQLRRNPKSERVQNSFHAVDPDGSLYNKAYWAAYAERLTAAVQHVEDYYADRMKEFYGMTVQEGMFHLRNKYIDSNSSDFCSGMSAAERSMSYKQELALFLGGNVSIGDPYALKAHGGLLNVNELDAYAKKAAEEYLAGFLSNRS